MGKERVLEATREEQESTMRIRRVEKKKKPRTSGFIHIGEIIPGVMRNIEKKIKEAKSPPLKEGEKK